ncbi:MAG: hypothetical protein LUH43_07240 [Clostridia bacterium]|nr:hypothetical protein [Clostridia bacterium]
MENAENSPFPFYLLDFPSSNHVEIRLKIMLTPTDLSTSPAKFRFADIIKFNPHFPQKGAKISRFLSYQQPPPKFADRNFSCQGGNF